MNALRDDDHVVVVGAGLAGWRVVESLRREGYRGLVTLIGDEAHAPYDRPPLSKQVLSGKWDVERVTLASPTQIVDALASLRLGEAAVELDVDTTSVRLASGDWIRGTRVVLALGARARGLRYESSGSLPTLRTLDDAIRLTNTVSSLEPGDVVVVIGGGFVGAEVATSLRARGATPVVLEANSQPLETVLGEQVAQWLFTLASDAGVELRVNQRINDVVTDGDGFRLHLDGGEVGAKAVVAAVGSSLDLEWLEGSGINLDGGVVVDAHAQCAPNVAAVGDVARFPLRTVGGVERVRIEHWQVAVDHAHSLAKYWMGGEVASELTIPYFWSDQYGKKIQVLGHPDPSDDVALVHGDRSRGAWLALYLRDGVVGSVVALSQPRALTLSKVLLESRTSLDEALRDRPWAN